MEVNFLTCAGKFSYVYRSILYLKLSYVTKFRSSYNQSITTATFNGDETTFPDDSILKSCLTGSRRWRDILRKLRYAPLACGYEDNALRVGCQQCRYFIKNNYLCTFLRKKVKLELYADRQAIIIS
jgi:hypothetical protein